MNRMERSMEVRLLAIKYRGEVIERMSWLEKFIDLYIANYFTKNDSFLAQEMQLFILGDNRINLENKRAIFQKIAEAHDLAWFEAYQSARKIESKKGSSIMNKDLVFVIEQRNIFAHLIADTSDEGLQRVNEIGFVRFKDKGETFWFTHEKFMEYMLTIETLIRYFRDKVEEK